MLTDHSPSDVCFNQRIRAALPHRSIFSRSKVHHGQVLKSEDKDTIFQLAMNSDEFYRTIVKLQVPSEVFVFVLYQGTVSSMLYELITMCHSDVSI